FRPEAEKATIQDAAELFIRHCERRLERKEGMSRGVYVWYAGQICNYICPSQKHYEATVKYRKRAQFEHGLGHLKLNQLTARTVSEFRDHLRDTGLSANSTRKIL